MLFQGSASQGSHVIAISADDADGLRQGTGFILNGKHQDRIGKGGTVCHDFGKDSKPGGILTALIDVCLQNVQPVKLGGFRTGNGTVGFVLFFGYQLGGYSGVGCFLCVETPECNVVMALTKGLGMTGDLPDIFYNCTGNTQKILMNFQFIDAVDIKITGENQIHGLTHFSRVAVFNGKHSHVTGSADHCVIGGLKIPAGDPLAVRKNPACGNMGESAFHTAVGYFQTVLHTVLVGPGEGHQIFEIIDVIALDCFIFNLGCIGSDYLILPFLVQNGESVFFFMFIDHFCSAHSFYEQLGHPGIHFVDDVSGLFQFVCHIQHSFSFYSLSAISRISFSVLSQPRQGSVMDLPKMCSSAFCAPSSR